MLKRLRESNQTEDHITKQRAMKSNKLYHPLDAPYLLIQNAKDDGLNHRAHHASAIANHTIKARDSIVGAESQIIRVKVVNKIAIIPENNTTAFHTETCSWRED